MQYRVENIMRKGEIACYKQFLLFSQCFNSYISLMHQNAALCGNGSNLLPHYRNFQQPCKTLVASIFTFSNSIFCPIIDNLHHFTTFVVHKFFSFPTSVTFWHLVQSSSFVSVCSSTKTRYKQF